ncbi:type VI secretion system ImpA family N-terminal domain-containing protein [Sphingomonas sp. 2R-10]|uniref:type VI secretion system protein TssA n=1 Tax=Sphingomonas sp. 2R-10 TaxID=3045148 RepID=UPI001F494FDE|nr:type VI secretion system ImpA family N-terminal domain-containing protein [Sphingomonas sp. 2R-10]MDJ0276626.1 type VI secretion system ImpA family N-terminal domain-containing protein [Sphingomonas sp. 2R-10]
MIDRETLLQPVSDEAPAGPDLSYDSSRETIEQAFSGPADEVDWDATVRAIVEQMERTRDLWLAVYLARAGARAGRLDVVGDAFDLLAGYLERFWDSSHPSLEEYGIEGRRGACESLVRIGEFLAPLRRVPLIDHPRLGSFSGGDFERFAAEGASAEGYGQFRAALADTPVDVIARERDQLQQIRAAILRSDRVLSDQAELVGQTGTNFAATYDTIDSIVAAMRPFVVEPATSQDAADGTADASAIAAGSAGSAPGRIASRDDVARAIDSIVEYYARVEPSSPIPIALVRIKGWITMDFVSILDDIAPGSRNEALSVLRSRSEEGGDSDLM